MTRCDIQVVQGGFLFWEAPIRTFSSCIKPVKNETRSNFFNTLTVWQIFDALTISCPSVHGGHPDNRIRRVDDVTWILPDRRFLLCGLYKSVMVGFDLLVKKNGRGKKKSVREMTSVSIFIAWALRVYACGCGHPEPMELLHQLVHSLENLIHVLYLKMLCAGPWLAEPHLMTRHLWMWPAWVFLLFIFLLWRQWYGCWRLCRTWSPHLVCAALIRKSSNLVFGHHQVEHVP